MLSIHCEIKEKLNNFIENNNVPHLLFYGPSGSGKKTLVTGFIRSIYNSNEYRENVKIVDCALGKGIQFIREEIKQFAKSHIFSKNNFKSILLYNADKLTIDAQSALRRCIELFSTTTRFFMILERKQNLLRPIISRFCEIYVYYPIIDDDIVNKKPMNLYKYKTLRNENQNKALITMKKNRVTQFNKRLSKCKNQDVDLFEVVDDLYLKGYSCYDVVNYYQTTCDIKILFSCFKNNYKNEKLLMYFLLFNIFRNKDNLEITSLITS